MNKARRLANRFGQIGREGDYVMIGSFFNFVDARDGEFCPGFYLFNCFGWNRAHLRVHFAHSQLDVEPFLEFGLLRPERTHFRKCVAFDHIGTTTFVLCSLSFDSWTR